MPQPEQYDALVLGRGEGGKYLARHLARSGRRVAVIERRWIGGSCPIFMWPERSPRCHFGNEDGDSLRFNRTRFWTMLLSLGGVDRRLAGLSLRHMGS